MTAHPPIIVDQSIAQFFEDTTGGRYSELDIRRPEEPIEALEPLTVPVAFVCTNRSWEDTYLDELPADSWVTTIGVGYERFPIEAFTEHDIAFTNNPGINAEQVAEHAFGMALAFTRQLLSYRDNQRAHEWGHWPDMTDFAGEDCCIVGLGEIGEAVAERATAFGMSVRGVKRTVDGYDGNADAVFPPDQLRNALRGAQLVVIAVPLTDQTRGMIGERELVATSDDAVIINVSRGPVLETEGLLKALSAGELRAAGLDVTDPEPLPPDSPLWDRRDVLITPHCAGASDKYPERFRARFLEQYDRWQGDGALHDRIR